MTDSEDVGPPMLAYCTEPDGRVEVPSEGIPAHDVMLDAQGYCPWCGAEMPSY